MSDNIYSAPNSEVEDIQFVEDSVLASRWARLGGGILDNIFVSLLTVPALFMYVGMDGIQSGKLNSMGIGFTIVISIVTLLLFFLINGFTLFKSGQTLGKKIVSTRIVSYEDEELASNGQLFSRYGFYLLIGQIPVIGQILSLINCCMIFGSEKRCLHDIIGKTKVIKA